MLQDYLHELHHRWKVVLLIAILSSIALIGEKCLVKDPILQSSSLYVEQMATIQSNEPVPESPHYDQLFTSYGNLINFLRQTEDVIDYEKFQPGWNRMNDEAKAKWAKKHIFVQSPSSDIVVFSFYIGEIEWKDPAYADEHGIDVMNYFVQFNEQLLQNLGTPFTLRTNEPVIVMPETIPVSKESLLAKYGVIGFVLGALAGTIGIFVCFLRKHHA